MKSLLVRLAVILVVFVMSFPYHSFAQQDSIWIGGMEIKVGMAKTTVLSEIAKIYNITKTSQDSWNITPKDHDGMVGAIRFKDEKVSQVFKYWGSFHENQGFEFAKNLFNLFSNLQTDGNKITSFYTSSIKEPTVSFEFIVFPCGDKEVQVLVEENAKSGRFMRINEVLVK
jgi:hypothetical protein